MRVKKIENQQELDEAFEIRREVFIVGQDCPEEEEFDDFDEEATHFIAYVKGEPAGTCRFRTTSKGVKLERFAVLEKFRGEGIGKRLVQTVLGYLDKEGLAEGTLIYLHSQVAAMGLYTRFGFEKVGEMFDEVGIDHYEMQKKVQG
ncbi:MAG: GNAT family N-acetyltransferase [Roseivirga sp.]|nr:GNAT family N-acetyltransferase [Roseivirga sp.]MBO6759624.1 GNAT family N-acetyltransferase [Roseivirga sp.]MBO6909343.1 GNAT family N-acetyltransferase [Roseivirga sp.]